MNPVARVVWWTVLAIACAHILVGARWWDVGVQKFVADLRPVGHAEPVGQGRRVFLDNDPYCWLTYARTLAEGGGWRVRRTDIDNVPHGREVHWSQSVSWCLLALGSLLRTATGVSWREALEAGAVLLNPLLLTAWVTVTGWLLARRLGVVPAVLWMITVATLPDIQWSFHPLRPDHQTFHWMFAFGTAIAVTLGGLGWVRTEPSSPARGWTWWVTGSPPTPAEARRWFLAAGVLSGLGLWTGATVQFFAVGAVAVGALGLALWMPARAGLSDADDTRYEPTLWRWWGLSAAVTALVMYAVEYLPGPVMMRLEVNHPLYALAAWGVGESLAIWTTQRVRAVPLSWGSWLRLAMAVAAMICVPLLVAFGPADWHRMRDPQMSRMHQFIIEFFSWQRFAGGAVWSRWWQGYGWLPVFSLVAVVLAGSRRIRVQEWAGLWLAFFLSWFFLALLFWQVRWAGAYALACAWVMTWAVYVMSQTAGHPGRPMHRGWASVATVAVVAQAVWFGINQQLTLAELRAGKVWDEALVDATMKKHLAEGLAEAGHPDTMRVLCEPDFGPALFYFGGIRSVTSFYWENVAGLHAASAVFAARDDATAHGIAQEHGLTHLVIPDDNRLPAVFEYVATGRRDGHGRGTVLDRLRRGGADIPAWVRVDRRLTAVGRREFGHPRLGRGRAVESRVTVYEIAGQKNHAPVTDR